MLQLAHAQVYGPPHLRKSTNRQDMLGWVFRQREDGEIVTSVVICDGGSPGNSSEVGAGIVSQKAAIKLDALVEQYGNRPARIATELHAYVMLLMRNEVADIHGGPEYLLRLDEEIRNLAQLGRPAEEADFVFDIDDDPAMRQVGDWVQNNLLFTFVAVFNSPEGTMVFQRGDGGVYIDGEVVTQSFDNVNPYFGYALCAPKELYLGDKRLQEQGFDLTAYRNASRNLSHAVYPGAIRVALFSDGMPMELIEEFFKFTRSVGSTGRNKAQKYLRQLLRLSMLDEEITVVESLLSRPDLLDKTREQIRNIVTEMRMQANTPAILDDDTMIVALDRS